MDSHTPLYTQMSEPQYGEKFNITDICQPCPWKRSVEPEKVSTEQPLKVETEAYLLFVLFPLFPFRSHLIGCRGKSLRSQRMIWRPLPSPWADFGSPRHSLAVPRGWSAPRWGTQVEQRSFPRTTACKYIVQGIQIQGGGGVMGAFMDIYFQSLFEPPPLLNLSGSAM